MQQTIASWITDSLDTCWYEWPMQMWTEIKGRTECALLLLCKHAPVDNWSLTASKMWNPCHVIIQPSVHTCTPHPFFSFKENEISETEHTPTDNCAAHNTIPGIFKIKLHYSFSRSLNDCSFQGSLLETPDLNRRVTWKRDLQLGDFFLNEFIQYLSIYSYLRCSGMKNWCLSKQRNFNTMQVFVDPFTCVITIFF